MANGCCCYSPYFTSCCLWYSDAILIPRLCTPLFLFFFVLCSLLYIFLFFSRPLSADSLCLARRPIIPPPFPPHQQQSKWDIMWSRLIVRPEPRRRRQLGNAAYWLRSDCFAQIVFGNWSLAFCSGCRRITGWYKFMQAWSHICQYDILCNFCYLVSTVEHWNAQGTPAESNQYRLGKQRYCFINFKVQFIMKTVEYRQNRMAELVA